MKRQTFLLIVAVASFLVLGLAMQCDPDPAALCTVTYDGNGSTGGTAPIDGDSYSEGDSVVVPGPEDLVRSGYNAFTGWNTAADGSGTAYTIGATLSMGTADVTLYAQWGTDMTIVGDWYIDDILDFYLIYPELMSMPITLTNTHNADGTMSATGIAGTQTMFGTGVYAYDPFARTLYVRYDYWEQPIGTPNTPPVQPTNTCVVVGDVMTITMPAGDYMWKDPMVYAR